MFRGTDIAIDLGTATVLVYVRGKGIVLKEPSVVAIDKRSNKVLAVGEEARRMMGRTPGDITVVRPLRQGVIHDYEVTEKMLRYFLGKVCGKSMFFKPRVMVCVPSGVTEVEKKAVIDATQQAGARKTYTIEEPLAAAIGAGLDITKPSGSLVVDIGGGTTDIAVISLGGIVISTSIKVAGDNFDDAIVRYVKKKYQVLIGERTAEEIKINVGAAYKREPVAEIEIRGRSLLTGLPKNVTVNSDEMVDALAEPVFQIGEAIHGVLEKTPPELAADISDKGIILTGGGSLLYGLDKYLQDRLRVPVNIADDPVSCVVLGTGKALDNLETLEKYRLLSKISK